MNIMFDQKKLLCLIENLNTITGIRANVYDLSGSDLGLELDAMPFCRLIQSQPGGFDRCAGCDKNAIAQCGEQEDVYFYRCHAGICEAVLPIFFNGRPSAYLLFGQFLDSTSREEQWTRTLARLDWFSGSPEELRTAFDAFRQYSRKELDAYLEILNAVKSYIDLSGMIRATEYTDQQRLELYIDRHYMEKLSLSSVSEALGIGRTRLCQLAKTLPGGHTLSYLITHRRVRAARELLLNQDIPISAVGEAVGISDYNYFTKIFRSVTGMTPSTYRKSQLPDRGPQKP